MTFAPPDAKASMKRALDAGVAHIRGSSLAVELARPRGKSKAQSSPTVQPAASGAGGPSDSSTGAESASSGAPTGSRAGRRLYLGGVPNSLDVHRLRRHYEQFGSVEDVYKPYDRKSRRSRKIAFVT